MKKYIFFIVEGKHDKDEISAILNTPYFSNFKERFEPCFMLPYIGKQGTRIKYSEQAGGDITTDKKTTESNIIGRLSEIINDYKKNGRGYPIAHADIARVVQITDADGTFISPNNIVSSFEEKAKYMDQTIETANVDGIIRRNKKKSGILRKLSSVTQICNIPYSIFYVSCNMDHVLFDEKNMTPALKTSNSLDFQAKCESNPNIIFENILKPGIATEKDYLSSWEYIQQENNSLKRVTNLNLLLIELSKELMKVNK